MLTMRTAPTFRSLRSKSCGVSVYDRTTRTVTPGKQSATSCRLRLGGVVAIADQGARRPDCASRRPLHAPAAILQFVDSLSGRDTGSNGSSPPESAMTSSPGIGRPLADQLVPRLVPPGVVVPNGPSAIPLVQHAVHRSRFIQRSDGHDEFLHRTGVASFTGPGNVD